MSPHTLVADLLTTLKDSFLGLTAQEMHLQYKLDVTESSLDLTLVAGFPCKTLQTSYLPQLLSVLEARLPQMQCKLSLQSQIQIHKTQLVGQNLRGVKNTIAIASGKGGVGKSTVAVNLAVALAKEGARVGILDADIYGPSIPLMLGVSTLAEVANDRYLPINAHGIQAMSIGYLTDNNQALLWRGPMLAKSLIQMLDITSWDNLDYLFIDLPPGTGDIQLSLVQKIPLTAAIVVTTPQTVATLDAQKAMQLFATTGIDVLGLIENMSTHQCSKCNHEEAIFGEGGARALCKAHNSILLGQLPLDSRIRLQGDQGKPQVSDAFRKAALNSVLTLASRPLNYASKLGDIPVVLQNK
jgi:ATP-binding protein involved in chromosome partitioning